MKTRFFLLLGFAGFSVSDVAGQGRFSFNNSPATAITDTWVQPNQPAGPNTKVAMYYNLNTNVTATWQPGWVLNTNAVTNISSMFPGRFIGGERTVPDVAHGTTIAVCIRAWSPPYPTWEAQEARWHCDPQPRGESRVFLMQLATSNGPPTLLVSAGLDAIQIFTHLGTRICEPLLRLQRDGSNVILHINANGPSGGVFKIESNSGFATNGWQVRTNITAQSNVTWVDSLASGSPLFYRVRNSVSP
jgi:hypothetical protein